MSERSAVKIRPDTAWLSKSALYEVRIIDRQCIPVGRNLAGYLDQYDVVAFEPGEDQCRAALGKREVGKGKRNDDYVTLYRSFHSSSSSGRSQSLASADSLTTAQA
jgi:hypothetical protein